MEKVHLKTIATQVRGVSYKPEDLGKEYIDGFVPLLRAGNIGYSTVSNLDDLVYVSEKNVSKHQYLQRGDILIAASSGSIDIVGKSVYIEESQGFTFGAFCKVVRPKKELVNPKYVSFYFQTDYYRKKISNLAQGANINNLKNEHIDNLEIPLPDLETQNKIVAILDKAKAIVNKREETIRKYDELLRAVFLDMFGDPVRNEKGWEKISLGELGLGDWKSGGTPIRSNRDFFAGQIPWVTSGELNDLYISSTKEKISQEAVEQSNAKLIPENSLLIGMYDTAALKSSINTIPLTCNQAIAYSQIDEQICKILYVHTAIQIGKDYFKSNQRGVRQQNLNLSMIKKITFPKPPIALQEMFVDRFNFILSAKNKIKKFRDQSQNLLKSLTQQVFSERITFDVDIELEALINAIDLDKNDEANEIDSVINDLTFVQRLIDRLAEQQFEDKDQYAKAKYILFRMLKEEKDLAKQVFRDNKIHLTLQNETT